MWHRIHYPSKKAKSVNPRILKTICLVANPETLLFLLSVDLSDSKQYQQNVNSTRLVWVQKDLGKVDAQGAVWWEKSGWLCSNRLCRYSAKWGNVFNDIQSELIRSSKLCSSVKLLSNISCAFGIRIEVYDRKIYLDIFTKAQTHLVVVKWFYCLRTVHS